MALDIIISRLKEKYPPGKFNSQDPFRVLIATILSQRTRDEITDRATGMLFAKFRTPAELAHAEVGVIEVLIHDAGFYRIKAPRIREIARIIDNDYGGRVPDDISELLLLPGVGRKTANCVLVYGFGKDAIAVDTHVHRISNRLGIVRTKKPDETEMELKKVLDKKHWRYINELFVRFGQDICRPVGPKCINCPVFELCPEGQIRI